MLETIHGHGTSTPDDYERMDAVLTKHLCQSPSIRRFNYFMNFADFLFSLLFCLSMYLLMAFATRDHGWLERIQDNPLRYLVLSFAIGYFGHSLWQSTKVALARRQQSYIQRLMVDRAMSDNPFAFRVSTDQFFYAGRTLEFTARWSYFDEAVKTDEAIYLWRGLDLRYRFPLRYFKSQEHFDLAFKIASQGIAEAKPEKRA